MGSNRVVISSAGKSENILGTRYTRQLLEGLSDQELRATERILKDHIRVLRKTSNSSKDFEIELCYVQDEINRRKTQYQFSQDS
jgi:hypothetical protein